ncbi:MAG: hypothetical protein IPN17_29160 [Deltaproteobacteria bacterium]|nr:hypothetical protein [Deltaproteobacteria bacterium]MBP6830780.1 hypothetical protein [Deltaproteobacteria bacterium]
MNHVTRWMVVGLLLSAAGTGCTEVGGSPDGAVPADIGTSPIDVGTQPIDAGTQPVDVGTQPIDAGTQPVDVGTQPVDVGTQPVDVGTQPTDVPRPPADTGPTMFVGDGTIALVAGEGDAVRRQNIAPGESFMPFTSDGIPPYSFSTHRFTIRNLSGAAVVINRVVVTPGTGSRSGEWVLNQPGSTTRVVYDVNNRSVPAMMGTEFGLHFVPVASGPRTATVTVTYNTSRSYTFTIQGRGRDNAVISPNLTVATERTYGRRTQSSLIGAAAADSGGNLYFSQNVTQWSDNFSSNIALARMNTDGTLAWQREWNEQFMQRQPDPGQNAEAGGGGNSVAMGPDGSLFFVGNRSLASTNNTFQGLVARVDPATGNMLWARGILRGTTPSPSLANQGVEAYAVDATLADRVIVAGAAGNGGILLAALSKTDGSLLWGRQLQLTTNGMQSRAHSLAVDAMGNGYLGGFTGDAGTATLIRVTGLNSTAPAVAWSKTVGIGRGGNINHLALDGAGGVVASLDYRGATTQLGVARFSSTGAVLWGRIWDAMNSGDNNNSYAVSVSGASVYLGGRVAIAPFDTTAGEGFAMRVGLADGAWQWGAFYYTGKTTTTISEHRVKAIIPTASGLLVLAQGFPGMNNENHYSGLWYQTTNEGTMFPSGTGSMRLANAVTAGMLMVTDRPAVSLEPLLFVQSATQMHPGTAHVINTSMIWGAPPADVTFVPPAERTANNGRGMALLQRLEVR